MEAKVMGISNTVAYKKTEKAMGNQGDPLNFLTTFHAETIIAIFMILLPRYLRARSSNSSQVKKK